MGTNGVQLFPTPELIFDICNLKDKLVWSSSTNTGVQRKAAEGIQSQTRPHVSDLNH